ncbi:MAG: glycosyltransferase family 2 protein [Halovenus sp.]
MDSSPVEVSVVLPTYNRADVLARSVESVLEQTFEDFELVVVDDASTDRTDAVIEQFDDDRLRYVRHDENRGAAAARNTGIREARADIVAFQDSDDVWDERKLEKQVAAFESSSDRVGVVYTGLHRQFENVRTHVPGHGMEPEKREGDIAESILRFNFVSTQAAAVRRSCFDRVGGFDDETPPLEDWELWIRISEFYEFKHVDEPLVSAYLREDSISNDSEALVRARERIVEKHRHRFDAETLARQYFWVGHGALKTGDTSTGRTYLRRALKTDPRTLYLGAFALSLLGSGTYRSTYSRFKDRHAGTGTQTR